MVISAHGRWLNTWWRRGCLTKKEQCNRPRSEPSTLTHPGTSMKIQWSLQIHRLKGKRGRSWGKASKWNMKRKNESKKVQNRRTEMKNRTAKRNWKNLKGNKMNRKILEALRFISQKQKKWSRRDLKIYRLRRREGRMCNEWKLRTLRLFWRSTRQRQTRRTGNKSD